MPRESRKCLNSLFFHVMVQGIEKRYIFNKTADVKYYIKLMYKLRLEYNIEVIAYCVMNNHTHMLLKVDDVDKLSKYMQRLNMLYGNYFNKKHKRVGFVFRNRFKSQAIFNPKHLYSCIHYIFNNPVKAGICSVPSEYPYSNYLKFVNDPMYKEIDKEQTNEYSFLDVTQDREIIIKELVTNFWRKNNLTSSTLDKCKDETLKELIDLLKDKYDISLREISSRFNLNRERVRRIYQSNSATK